MPLRSDGHAFQPLRIGKGIQDGFGEFRGVRTIDQEAVTPLADQLGKTVTPQADHRRPRYHGLEIDLPPGVVEHRLHEQGRLAVEPLKLGPRQMGAQFDARPIADEGPAALVTHDRELEIRPTAARQVECLQQQQAWNRCLATKSSEGCEKSLVPNHGSIAPMPDPTAVTLSAGRP